VTTGPDFLCIGAHKAGTTWLYENLRRHPSVWLPPLKEVHFFDGLPYMPKVAQRLSEAIKAQLAGDPSADPARLEYLRKYVLDQPKDIDWYRSLFSYGEGRTCGDITPAYSMLKPADVARVHAILPVVRIIFIMRNPIDRAWSHFRTNAGSQQIDLASRQPASMIRHFDSGASERRSRYTNTIAAWESCYPRERILYLFHEDIQISPDRFLESVCGFLDLDFDVRHFEATRSKVVHQSLQWPMPLELRRYLAGKYHDEIVALQRRFGGHTDRWLEDCERLLSDGES
jgi:hypothetical protein